ncbi:MAG TPA: GNAT family N-acetyltransferase [Streptosporangiaceae bacterium]|jgi:RimJ/RimL family protein N-acetyltransferase
MMIHPDFQRAMVRERSATLLAAAAAQRQARRARSASAAAAADAATASRQVRLRDGSAVLIRPVRRTDSPLLAEGFARLSERSRWTRFLGRKNTLTEADLSYFTDIDHHDHEALGALDHVRGGGVGIARYVRDREDRHAAEIAVTIVDDWQGRGLATELLAQLSDRACQEGIRRFTAVVAADNAAANGLLRNSGASLIHRGRGIVEYELDLTCVRAQAS